MNEIREFHYQSKLFVHNTGSWPSSAEALNVRNVPAVEVRDKHNLLTSTVLPSAYECAKFPHRPILHYASIFGALLFSVSPLRCACIMTYGAVRKIFLRMSF